MGDEGVVFVERAASDMIKYDPARFLWCVVFGFDFGLICWWLNRT